MPRPRIGSFKKENGRLYARVTWVESGRRYEKRKLVANEVDGWEWIGKTLKKLPPEVTSPRFTGPSPSDTLNTSAWIYCLQINDGGMNPIKIGITTNVKHRLSLLMVSIPYSVTLLGVWEGTVFDERRIHKQFKHLHIRGEWFSNTEELQRFIREMRIQQNVA